jgi:hypothetical protein
MELIREARRQQEYAHVVVVRDGEQPFRRDGRQDPDPLVSGRHLLQPALERPLGTVFLAGDYLGTTYVDTAVTTGTAAAHAIRRRLRE